MTLTIFVTFGLCSWTWLQVIFLCIHRPAAAASCDRSPAQPTRREPPSCPANCVRLGAQTFACRCPTKHDFWFSVACPTMYDKPDKPFRPVLKSRARSSVQHHPLELHPISTSLQALHFHPTTVTSLDTQLTQGLHGQVSARNYTECQEWMYCLERRVEVGFFL